MSKNNTAVIIVAAGRGSRMGPLTSGQPKSLISFAGRRLIEWQLSALRSHGLTDVTIVGGYRAEQLAPYARKVTVNTDWEKTNMVYSLMCARDALLSGKNVIVAYADIIYEHHVLAALLECDGDAATVIDRNWLDLWKMRSEDPLEDAETLRVSEAGTILEIGRHPTSLEVIQGQYIGLTKFSGAGAKAFNDIYEGIEKWQPGKKRDTCYFTDVLDGMIGSGFDLFAAFTDGGWLEFDTSEDLSAYESGLADGSLRRFWSPDRVTLQ